jgi:hypothetical protein
VCIDVSSLLPCVQAKLAAEQARLQKELDASSTNLQKAQEQLEQQLQGIQNKKQRLEAEMSQAKAEAAARLQRSQLTSVSPRESNASYGCHSFTLQVAVPGSVMIDPAWQWWPTSQPQDLLIRRHSPGRPHLSTPCAVLLLLPSCDGCQVVKLRADLLKLSQEGAACLPAVKQHLLDASGCTDTLDVVFETPSLGQVLTAYAAAPQDSQVGGWEVTRLHLSALVLGSCRPPSWLGSCAFAGRLVSCRVDAVQLTVSTLPTGAAGVCMPCLQVQLPQLPKAAERGLSLLAKGELVEALQVFDSLLKTSASNNSSCNGSKPNSSASQDTQLLQALTELCQRKLQLPVSSSASMQPPAMKPRAAANRAGTADAGAAASIQTGAHPVQHLVAALQQSAASTAAAASRMRQGVSVTNYRQQRAVDAAAAAQALAFLMHPAVFPQAAAGAGAATSTAAGQSTGSAALQACLISEAWAVLRAKGTSAFSSTSASPLLPEASSSKAGSGSQQELKARAKGSKVLLELLEMTGLEPVKQAMLNLAEEVGGQALT